MEISIVIPVRNRAELVERTLKSVERQSYRPLSVILVDNGSTDGTRQTLERWAEAVQKPDFKVKVIDEPEPGASSARNAGLKVVDTDWTMFFDSDDVMFPEHVERAMKCAAKHPKAGIIGWDVKGGLASGGTRICPFFSSDMLYNNIMHGGFATQRYMARTDIFRRAGGWNAQALVWNDIELGTRLLTLDPVPVIFKVNGRPQVETFFISDSITGTSWSGKAEDRLNSIGLIEALLPRNMKWIASLKRGQLARVCRKEGRRDMAEKALGQISGSMWQRAVCRLAAYVPTDILRPLL